jgi:16S rRNA (cytosine1407-C5)-methyltransferase
LKKDFIDYIKQEFGFSDKQVEKFENSLNTPLKKSIRINTNKISVSDFKKRAKKNNWTLTATKLWKNIFYIDRTDSREVALWNTPEHIAGYFYVQEVAASSSPFFMSKDKIDTNPYLILDMSASPGWKTTQLSEYYPNSLIIANELDKSRLKGFFSNLDRMSSLWVVATNYDGRFFKNTPELFDKILLDAPCSWEWTAFKADEALKYWNIKNIKTVAKLQFGLLDSALKALKNGWEIIYSTCTLNKIENEGVLEKLSKKYPELIKIETIKRAWPHIDMTGWFFVARIIKVKNLENKKEIQFVRQNIEKLSKTDCKVVEWFFYDTFKFDLSSYYIYNYMWEIHLSKQNLNDIWEKVFSYKIWVKIWEIKSWVFSPNFYAWTFARFEKNILEVDKDSLDKLLKWFDLEKCRDISLKHIKDWYYQIIHNDIELWMAKFKNEKLKSLIPSKMIIN